MKLKKGMIVAHVEASQVVPLFNNTPLEKENVCEEITKESKSKDLPKEKKERMSKILEKLEFLWV